MSLRHLACVDGGGDNGGRWDYANPIPDTCWRKKINYLIFGPIKTIHKKLLSAINCTLNNPPSNTSEINSTWEAPFPITYLTTIEWVRRVKVRAKKIRLSILCFQFHLRYERPEVLWLCQWHFSGDNQVSMSAQQGMGCDSDRLALWMWVHTY